MSENLLKSLDTIALGHSEGYVSTDMLVKACNTYKQRTGFEDDYMYQLILSKSLNDQLNGLEQDTELCKAIVPGDTKVIDGVLYVWSRTKSGSQTQYAWHVANKNIGRGSTLPPKVIADLEKQVNDMFPIDLKSLKVIKQNIGGSTGAELVEDVKGNQYIKKKGTNKNTNNDHVINEYLANQLYSIAGVKVPKYQLYDDNGTAVLLSKFIYNARPFNSNDYQKLKDTFIIDCLFANWDAYANNDNCLIDSKGNVVHVDNGGTLNFRAHGAQKVFDGDILSTFKSMQIANKSLADVLTDDDVKKQIAEIRKKKGDLVRYLKEVGEDDLSKTIAQRIDNLDDIINDIEAKKNFGKRKVLPRKLMPEKDMYREFTEQELNDVWDKITKICRTDDPFMKIMKTEPGTGWLAISEVCKMRGFNARGKVVSDKEYWDVVDKGIKDGKFVQILRGLSPDNRNNSNKGKITIEEAVDSLLYQDKCYYGTQAVYGGGVYAHINDNNDNINNQTKSNYDKTGAYKHAIKYAHDGGVGLGAIVKMALPDDFAMAEYDDIKNEVLNLVATDKIAVNKCEGELNAIDSKLNAINKSINNYNNKVIEDTYKDIHYDEKAWKAYSIVEENTDWGAVNAFGDRDIPKFDDFVGKEMAGLIKANGGTITQKKGVYVFTLPNSDEEFSISNYQYDGPSSIKRKNNVLPHYNYAVSRFNDWFERVHVKFAQKAKEDALSNSNAGMQKLMDKRSKLNAERTAKSNELDELRNPTKSLDTKKNIYHAIYDSYKNKYRKEGLGLYAALKGYDGIHVKDGNGEGNGFVVILNRSKLIINDNVNWNI